MSEMGLHFDTHGVFILTHQGSPRIDKRKHY